MQYLRCAEEITTLSYIQPPEECFQFFGNMNTKDAPSVEEL